MTTAPLSPAQQTQIDNRDATGQWKQKAHGGADEDADILGIDDTGEEAVDEPAVDPPVRYSFLKEFELAEEKFNTDFEGTPNRFYNADLRGKYLNRVADDDLELFADALADPDSRAGRYFDNRGLSGRLCHAVSSPEDNKVDDQTAVEMIENLDHVTEVHTIEKDSLLATMGKNASRGWLAKMETVNADGEREQRWLAVSDASHNQLKTFTLRSDSGPVRAHQQVTQTDIRSLAGAERLSRRTGENLLARTALHPHSAASTNDYPDDYPQGYSHAAYQQRIYDLKDAGTSMKEERSRRTELAAKRYADNKVAAVQALAALEDAQLEGRNFIAQRKHVREQNATIASAFDDKKNPDRTRQDMMASTSLSTANGGHFSKVEIDDDVDPEEYADFENAVHDAESKLPPIPADRRPDLRIRKLGKHNANGVYNPARNTVAVDVRTSEAYIHEMGHYYDLTAKGNASLSEDFKSISRAYNQALDEPDTKRRGYLNTPTEQLARGFEVYAHERLGINNRLVNPSKFDRNDYAPYTEDPQLKEKTFAYFDKLFG